MFRFYYIFVQFFLNQKKKIIHPPFCFHPGLIFLSEFNLSISFHEGLFIAYIMYELPRRRFAYRISLFFLFVQKYYFTGCRQHIVFEYAQMFGIELIALGIARRHTCLHVIVFMIYIVICLGFLENMQLTILF